jgi:predicted phosphodiesterase|tara:strand:- start:221 stop:1255 length:1035 start_codon:yes stop_codon:yes gene_type:complete
MRTLVLGDIHISNKDASLREAQEKCVKKIYDDVKPDEVIQLGDFLDFRKPSPEALLSAKRMVDHWRASSDVYIIRGNHCASTKADDGVTAMTLLERNTTQEILPHPRNRTYRVKIITHTWYDHRTKRAFIPHYENEERIKKDLASVPKHYTVFGHFGYFGCLNSVGDHDFNININSFRSDTILGHIHRQNQRTFTSDGEEKSLLILGTPYTTNFGEAGKENYYAVLEKGETTLHQINHGPRHLLLRNSEVQERIEEINDPNYHTFLRVILEPGETQTHLENIQAASVDIKYSAAFNEEQVSDFKPSRELFRVNDVVIEDYINSANSSIEKNRLLEGYNLLKYED